MTNRLRLLAAFFLLAVPVVSGQGRAGGPPAAGSPPSQQPGTPPEPDGPPTAAISGIVVEGGTGVPVPGAVVSINLPGFTVPSSTQLRQLTDDKGRFAFVNIWGGYAYQISVTKFGYLAGGVGREKSPDDPIKSVPVAKDQWRGDVRATIWRPAAVSGAVRDERGEPMVGIIVRALVRYRLMGRDELAAVAPTVTDDRGMYRLAGLVPGRYLIQVPSVQASMPTKTAYNGPSTTNAPDGGIEIDDTSRLVIGRYPLPPPPVNGRPMMYPMAFHPAGTSVADAMTIELKYGDDRQNVDVTLAPMPAVRVSGMLDGPPEAMTLMTVRLLAAGLENLGQGSETATALVDSGGQFTFVNVPPGTYTIDAPVNVNEFLWAGSAFSNRPASFPAPPGTGGWSRTSFAAEVVPGVQFGSSNFRGSSVPNYSGRGTVTVGTSDVTGVVVRLKPMITVSGKIVVDLDPLQPPPAAPPRFSFTLDPANGEVYLGSPRSQQTPDAQVFTVPAVMPGQYWVRSSGPTAWMIKSVVWKGRDYTTTPLDASSGDDMTDVVVTMTNNRPTLSGIVRSTGALKAEDCMVVVFPVERAQWRGFGLSPTRLRTATIGDGDAYSILSLPAGDYIVAAIDRAKRGIWRDPANLAQLEGAGVRVSLAWGAKVTQEVPVVVIK